MGWIEPIAGLFHLQMNILKLFTFTFWGQSNNECFFLHFSIALKRKIYKNVKDFYSNNDFFCTIIHFNIIALCIHESGRTKFNLFQRWVSTQNWLELFKEVEKKYLYPFLVHLIHCQSENAVANKVNAIITAQQEDWPNIRIRSQHIPDWEEVYRKFTDQLSRSHRDMVRENVLLLTSCGLLYLNFVNACQNDYSRCIEKCIQLFAIIFQKTKFCNSANETLYMMACFR